MVKIEKIKLNDNISIYKSNYDWKFSKEDLISLTKHNIAAIGLSDITTSPLIIKSPELEHLYKFNRDIAFRILGNEVPKRWFEKHWVYASNRFTTQSEREAPLFHNHEYCVNTHNRQSITTDLTYCFYLNVPNDLQEDEGKLEFKDTTGEVVSFLPSTGEILFFDPIYLHKPNFIYKSKQERIVICSNLKVEYRDLYKSKTLI